MNKELTIYKNPDKEFVLVRWEQITPKHRRLWFTSQWNLESDSLIWAKIDVERNHRPSIMVVEFSYPQDGELKSVRVRLADEGFMNKTRKFKADEVFLLIASFKETLDEVAHIHVQ